MTNVKDTSKDYDSCVGKVDKSNLNNSLSDFLGIEEKFTPEDEQEAVLTIKEQEWEKHWKGMPAYKSDDLIPKISIKVHFVSETDFNLFCEKLDLKLTVKTKSTFYPIPEINSLKGLMFINENDLKDKE